MLANIGCFVFFAILDCQGRLSCVPLVSFMNFLVCLSVCFYNEKKKCVFILVFIGDQAISCVDKMPTALALGPPPDCVVFREHCTYSYSCVF